MTAYRLTRAGDVDLEFTGECLADTSSRERADQPRWSEVRIYRTDSGKYVTEMIGRSIVPGEIDRINVQVVDQPDGIRAALARKGDNRYTKVPGNPNRPYLTELAIEAMEAAGERDEAIKATLVERI